MPNNANQKLRFLNLLRILQKKTDHENGLTTHELLDELENVGITTERKSLYRDIKAIRDFGLEISQDSLYRWHLETRLLSKEQLIMLVDSVQSTPFLTHGITNELIERMMDFASIYQEEELRSRLIVSGYIKMTNEDVFWNIDAIQRSLHAKRKLRFKYFRYNGKKEKLLQKNGDDYLVTPLRLIYADDTYYLITYSEKYQCMTPYRVDRMIDVSITDEPIGRNEKVATWRLEDNVVLSFGVFGSEVKPITLECSEEYANTIIDRFGIDADLRLVENGHIMAYVKAPLSPQFFGWLFQLGNHVKIVHPKYAIEEYKEYLNEIINIYSAS